MLNKCYGLVMNDRVEKMVDLRRKGFSYQAIGNVFELSRARIHQLTSGYSVLLTSIQEKTWYNKIRQIIFERDNSLCVKCGAKDQLLVHHIDWDDRNNELFNLVTLCHACHCPLHIHGVQGLKEVEFMDNKEILKLRKSLGLTQKELAARVKVDAITISRWERGEQRPSSQAQRQLIRLTRKG